MRRYLPLVTAVLLALGLAAGGCADAIEQRDPLELEVAVAADAELSQARLDRAEELFGATPGGDDRVYLELLLDPDDPQPVLVEAVAAVVGGAEFSFTVDADVVPGQSQRVTDGDGEEVFEISAGGMAETLDEEQVFTLAFYLRPATDDIQGSIVVGEPGAQTVIPFGSLFITDEILDALR